MPGQSEQPDSWLRATRKAAGFSSAAAFGEKIGAPIQTLSRWELGISRPPWPWPRKIAEALGRPLEEAVEHLWGERLGDPCQRSHDCGGVKILPDDPLVLQTLQPSLREYASGALKLLIKIKCTECEVEHAREHAYPPYGAHPKVCWNCSDKGVKVDRQKYKCVGYSRYGKVPAHGPSCPREDSMTRSEADSRFNNSKSQRQPWRKYTRIENGHLKSVRTSGKYSGLNWERPFADHSTLSYRCKSCSFASMHFVVDRARLEEIEGENIRSEIQHGRSWRENYEELTPGFGPQAGLARRKQLEKTGGKKRIYGERHRVNTSRGKTIGSWYDVSKNKAIVALCDVCDELTFGYGHARQFHDSPCYDSVQRGAEIFPKEGVPPENINLKRALCWAVRYLLFNEKFKEIADDSNQDRMFVKREIKRILSLVPHPDKVARPFKKIVSMIRQEALKICLADPKAASKIVVSSHPLFVNAAPLA